MEKTLADLKVGDKVIEIHLSYATPYVSLRKITGETPTRLKIGGNSFDKRTKFILGHGKYTRTFIEPVTEAIIERWGEYLSAEHIEAINALLPKEEPKK